MRLSPRSVRWQRNDRLRRGAWGFPFRRDGRRSRVDRRRPSTNRVLDRASGTTARRL